ncbi:MAG: type II toxin-antitoxin system PrlF family antitoxin [Alphaproteobacteria bacterium]|nr:type II toxin-antitoxin system PrlF family antitoxin [Alphaproteobacteria bacterium]
MLQDHFITSKVTSKSQTVIPMAVRNKLGLKPGDMVRYRFREDHVEIEKLAAEGDGFDPFMAFHEWASAEDEEAFKDL